MPTGQRITPQDYRKLCRILEKDDCYFVKQEGSHLKYRKVQEKGRVPRYKTIPVEIIKSILNQAKISRERYFELLDQL
jgi:predicted RNA binding protein YcfA (HicA-like mRNA interferase family)